MSGRKQWNKQAATSSFLDKKTPQSLIQQGLEGSTVVGKDEVTSSNLVSSSKMNDPTQFEQVNETCEFGGVVVYSESLGMTGFSRVGMSKRMRDIKIQTVSKRSRKRAN